MRRKLEEKHDAPAVEIPHDPINEQIVIAAAVLDAPTRTKLVGRVRSDLFVAEGHADLWLALQELQRQTLEYDPHTLRQLSGGKVDLDYLGRLLTAHPIVPPNLGHHLAMLEWDHARVDAVRGPISAMLAALRDPVSAPERVRALARQVAAAFDGQGDRRYLRDPEQLIAETMASIEKRRDGHACWAYGIDDLDTDKETNEQRLIPGAAPGQMTVVTGVPGSGKSTVTARIALGMARQKRRVLYGAWEMGDGLTLELLAAMSLGWSRRAITTGNLTDDHMVTLEERMRVIGRYVRFMQMPFGRERGQGKPSNDRNLDIVHGYIADAGCDVAIFDLWKRCLRYTDPDDKEQALVRQQAIAAETQCHCILVQQQRAKDIEGRPDKRPTREGIKGSGAWIEVADTILGVHRPALWKRVDDDTLEVDVLKQRYAPWPIAVEFYWGADTGSISNGRTVEYDPPGSGGASELDTWVSSNEGGGKGGGRKRKN